MSRMASDTPDFEHLARQAISGSEFHIKRVAEQLRQAWNARGAADLENLTDGLTNAVDDWVRAGAGTYDELQAVVEQTLQSGLQRLDR